MKLTLSVFMSALIGIFAMASASAEDLVAQEYTISGVTEVSAGGGGIVQIVQGDSESLRVEAAPDVMKRVTVDLTKSKLSLGVKDINGNFYHWFDRNKDPVKFFLQVKNINSLEIMGSAQASIGKYQGEKFWLKNSGASKVTLVDLSVSDLSLESSGAAEIQIQALNSQKAVVDLSGASNLSIKKSGAIQQLTLKVSGASNYRGRPLSVAKAEAEASGASNIDIQVSESLHAIASGASNIDYYGSAQVTFSASGASHVNGHQ